MLITRFIPVLMLGFLSISTSAHAALFENPVRWNFWSEDTSTSAREALFQDVPNGHEFQVPIERLAGSGIIKGNPDGNYYPDQRVNRAEMLTMLYRATNIVPRPSSKSCFPDVETGAWYEAVVCDGVAKKFVSGYPDGLFRPADSVSRVEALKMIHTVFEFQVSSDANSSNSSPAFVDVPKSAWFAGYVANAYAVGILPISGQDGTYFRPELSLTRKEAAAYIHNAFYARNQLREKARIAARPHADDDAIAAKQRRDVNTILNAVYQYTIDNKGKLPAKLTVNTPTEICASSGKECVGLIDLSDLRGSYLSSIPSQAPAPRTGYALHQDSNGRIIVSSLTKNGDETISVTR